jgi:DNA-binding CsgD family transcriptional regulator
VLTALRSELDWAGHPTVLVVEDVHWADEATLDVLRYLARRVADLPAVLMLTYRDDELTREHPLQPLLGQSCTNAEIADRLVVSTRTVDSHVAAVLAKLGVTTRRAGAARARDLGVLDPEVP